MIQVKYHVDWKQSTSSNFKILTTGKIYSVEKPLLNNSAKTIRDTIKKIMQHVHEWRTQWQLTIKLNNPRLFVHIIIGVTFFISHLFITIYNILTYQVVLFLVKKNVFKVIYRYRYILMTIIESKSFDNGCYQSLLHQYS